MNISVTLSVSGTQSQPLDKCSMLAALTSFSKEHTNQFLPKQLKAADNQFIMTVSSYVVCFYDDHWYTGTVQHRKE